MPVDLLHGLSTNFMKDMPELIPQPLKDQGLPLEFHWVSENGPKEARKLTSGLNVTPTVRVSNCPSSFRLLCSAKRCEEYTNILCQDSFADCPPLDIALVGAHNIHYVTTDAERAFVRKTYENCAAFMTVCGGVQIAVEAGLVAGKTATGPRFLLPLLRAAAPDATWVEKRYVQDGKLWTSGALLNGLDMMTEFIKQTWRPEGQELNLVDYGLTMGSAVSRDVDYNDEQLPKHMVAISMDEQSRL